MCMHVRVHLHIYAHVCGEVLCGVVWSLGHFAVKIIYVLSCATISYEDCECTLAVCVYMLRYP